MVTTVQQGGAIGKALDRGANQLRRQVDEHLAAMRELDEAVTDLVDRRGAALLELSRHYLPDITLASVQGSFREIRDELMEVLLRSQRREREVRDQIALSQEEVDRLENSLDEVTAQLDEMAAERERLEALLAERLHASDQFQVLSKQALEAELELEKNEGRVAEINQEAAEKLPSYNKSRLFQYLFERGYGTGEYQQQGWTKRLDGWVAKMINFPSARRSYQFLKTTPPLMEQEVERRRELFNQLMEKVEAIEDENSDEIGLTDVMRQGQEIGAQRDSLVTAVADQQDRGLALEADLLRLEGTDNEFYEQAVARMRHFLSTMDDNRLQQHSLKTPQREDDAIVAEVVWLSDQLDDATRRGEVLGKQRWLWDDRLSGLQQIQQRFRQAEYDSGRSMFDPRLDIDRLVGSYLNGDVGPEKMWTTIRKYQRFSPSWRQQNGGGLGGIIDSEMSYVLMRVLADVAGHALRSAAHRGMQRRGSIRNKQRRKAGRPKLRRRGFTKGRGF